MKNIEKLELKRDIKELAQKGYSQKEAVKILKEWGYCEGTARAYWKTFSDRWYKDSQLAEKEKEQ